ncbi:Bug family tripartite tricarboxylate transporter substrate binding protein [Achromobacter aloeverae]
MYLQCQDQAYTGRDRNIAGTMFRQHRKNFDLMRWFVLAVLCVLMNSANAGTYPDHLIRFVNPSSAGGNVDTVARYVAQKVSAYLGVPVMVENRTGASSIIGSDYVARSAPNGYTFLFSPAGTFTINPGFVKKLPYDTLKDFSPVSIVAEGPLVLVANPALGVNSLKDLIALAKSKPDDLVAATGGNGTAGHLALELFERVSGTKFLTIHYTGNTAGLNDTLAGRAQIMVDTPSTSLPFIKAGKLRALAVTGSRRLPMLPDVPTIAESGFPGYQADVKLILAGPAGLPPDIVNRMSEAVAHVAHDPASRQHFADQGVELVGSTPQEMAEFVAKDIIKWTDVIHEAGIVRK